MESDRKYNYNHRLEQYKSELRDLYFQVYGDNEYYDTSERFESLLRLMDEYEKCRLDKYKHADIHNTEWYKSNDVVAITLYVDLFCGNLINLKSHIPYFKELGINLIHFMPLLESKSGDNDGGYAVKNYKNIDPKFGTNKQFSEILDTLKENGIYTCIDFVVNHTANEHEFAERALLGEKKYMDMYFMYDTHEIPSQFELTVPEAFPTLAPGNFTYCEELNKWIFTSFYSYQWDLNYSNPLVFENIVDILLFLANKGVDVIRLDAIPHIWKQIGHSCRNHPTVHLLLRMMNIVGQVVCPSVALLGEAIVEPEEIVKYFGETAPECNLMYNATHMVNMWNSVATRDTRVFKIDTDRLKAKSGGVWINYARCHDDIGWGFNEEAIGSIGFNPSSHKQFLINFFRGNHSDSFSIGDLYEFRPDTMDARNCGTLASLLGLESAIANSDEYQRELALKRINLFHNILISSSGIPLIYSGDELGSLNKYDYLDDPKKMCDSRWIHRSRFDHEKSNKRSDIGTNEHSIFSTLKKMIAIRKSHNIFSSNIETRMFDFENRSVYGFYKKTGSGLLVCLSNFSEDRQFISNQAIVDHGIRGDFVDLLSGKSTDFSGNKTLLGPYEFIWLFTTHSASYK